MAIIGDQFDECRVPETGGDSQTAAVAGSWEDGSDSGGMEWPEICGCTISVRQSEDIISLWNKVDGDIKVRERIRWVFCTPAVVIV
jgi:translation initiation factor 4E